MPSDMIMSALPTELIALACQWISASDLLSMRLVSRNVSAITTPATFETVTFSPSTVACLLDEFSHLVPHMRYTRLLCDGSERGIEQILDKLAPWPLIRQVEVSDNCNALAPSLYTAIRQTQALLSARADKEPFTVTYYERSHPEYRAIIHGGSISLSILPVRLQYLSTPPWMRASTRLASSLSVSRCVITRHSIVGVLVINGKMKRLAFTDVLIELPADSDTPLFADSRTFTWKAMWSIGWGHLAALSVEGCGYARPIVASEEYVRMSDGEVGAEALEKDARALAYNQALIELSAKITTG